MWIEQDESGRLLHSWGMPLFSADPSQTTVSDLQQEAPPLKSPSGFSCRHITDRHHSRCFFQLQQCINIQPMMRRPVHITDTATSAVMVFFFWLAATTARRSACSQRLPAKPGRHTQAGSSSCTRYLQVPWKQKLVWASGQSRKWDLTAAATGGSLIVIASVVFSNAWQAAKRIPKISSMMYPADDSSIVQLGIPNSQWQRKWQPSPKPRWRDSDPLGDTDKALLKVTDSPSCKTI